MNLQKSKHLIIHLLLLILAQSSLHAQQLVSARILNNENPVPYATILIKGTENGTHANADGYFQLFKFSPNDTLIISSIGFKSKIIAISDVSDVIELEKELIALHEVSVSPRGKITQNINPKGSKRSNRLFTAKKERVYEIAHYEAFQNSYAKTPYLHAIKFRTSSQISDAIILLKIYELKRGDSIVNLTHQNIIVKIKKGNSRLNQVDLSDYNIKFPTTGIYIAFEWIDIPTNWHENKEGDISIEPMIYMNNSTVSPVNKLYSIKNKGLNKMTMSPAGLAVELTLSN